jgi:HK97 family phage prohead protease
MTTVHEPTAASRAEAAEARQRAFADQSAVVMPDRSQRQQTRSETLGPGMRRESPFGAEVRGKLEKRDGKELYHLHGYATVFDTPYPMWDMFGEYDEIVRGGAADLTLAKEPDVSFLVNHGGVTMARTTNGSLELEADKVGLAQDAWLNPDRSDVQILMSAIDDKLITEMSFAFMIPDAGGWWSEDFQTFEIRQFDLDRGDVSAVNYGANPYTSIAARAREVMTHIRLLTPGMRGAFADALGGRAERWQRALDESERPSAEKVLPTVQVTRVLTAKPTPPRREPVPDRQGRCLEAVERLLND